MRFFSLLLATLLAHCALSQELNVPTPQHVPTKMRAYWVTHPNLIGTESAVVLFRKRLNLPQRPAKWIVNVSADNNYTLYVNGRQVCFGPQLSDIRHWRYETIDLAPFLHEGPNVVVAEVVNFGPDRFFGKQSYRTAFLLNQLEPAAGTDAENDLSTTKGWETLHNRGMFSKPVRWRVRPEERDIVGGFYAVNPTDSLNAATYPWGWQTGDDLGGDWKPARFCENASAFGGGFAWLLEPRNTPLQTQRVERIARLARTTGNVPNTDELSLFLQGKSVTISPNTSLTLLLDNRVLTIGYPELKWSGGNGATVKIGYAENLFIPGTPNKGNRSQIDGMRFVGMKDAIAITNGVMSGNPTRTFRPTWLRTFRFIQLEITTRNEALTLHDFYNNYTSSPYPVKARFAADKPEYAGIFDLCRRTAELCTQDYFLSDAYYETMQYVGDSKVHDLTWLSLTGNDRHVRNALEQFNHSRLWDGNLTSCYPLRSTFVHPTYSVIWVDMLWDYLLWSGDREFIRQFVPGIRQTMSMFDGLIQPNGFAAASRWDHFIDWYQDSKRGGLAPGQEGGNSAVVTLHYVYALQNAAKLFTTLGDAPQAATYLKRAEQIKRQVAMACFDVKRGLMAERPTKDYFDQHTNIMAVLTDALTPAQQKSVLQKIMAGPPMAGPPMAGPPMAGPPMAGPPMADSTLGQATYYYRFYLLEAINKTGSGELLAPALAPWKSLLADSLSTTPERFESKDHPTRSECHPWSTAPAYAVFSTIAGIRPTEVGFKKLLMAPNLGELNHIEGTYPHPAGEIRFTLDRKGSAGLSGTVSLPAGVSGAFRWQGRVIGLREGDQPVSF